MKGVVIASVRLYEGAAGTTVGPRYFKKDGKPFMGCPVVESKDRRFQKYVNQGLIIPTDSNKTEIVLPLDTKTLKPTVSLEGAVIEDGKVKVKAGKGKKEKAAGTAGGDKSDGEARAN